MLCLMNGFGTHVSVALQRKGMRGRIYLLRRYRSHSHVFVANCRYLTLIQRVWMEWTSHSSNCILSNPRILKSPYGPMQAYTDHLSQSILDLDAGGVSSLNLGGGTRDVSLGSGERSLVESEGNLSQWLERSRRCFHSHVYASCSNMPCIESGTCSQEARPLCR